MYQHFILQVKIIIENLKLNYKINMTYIIKLLVQEI